jgi:Leucine-rich repeat (LRR) protein
MLENQGLSELKREDFEGARKLKTLHIQNNKGLFGLEPFVFAEASSLKFINLENNGLTRIDKLAFYNLQDVQEIYLKGNKLHMIHTTTFNRLIKLETLDLGNNICISKLYSNIPQNSPTQNIAQDLLKDSCHMYYTENDIQTLEKMKTKSMNIGIICQCFSFIWTFVGLGILTFLIIKIQNERMPTATH